MRKKETECWICGALANSKEHIIKASDLKSTFGAVSQEKPLRFSDGTRKNVPIKSYKSDRLKHTVPICEKCNSARTQPHDKSWAILSEAIRTIYEENPKQHQIRGNKVFIYDTRKHLLNIHLYFLKHFGCRIVNDKVPIEVKQFREAILNSRHCRNVFLRFGCLPGAFTGVTPIQVKQSKSEVVAASTYYCVDNYVVNIFYAVNLNDRYCGMLDAFHPSNSTTLLKLFNFGDEKNG